jgi:hypothetical protein
MSSYRHTYHSIPNTYAAATLVLIVKEEIVHGDSEFQIPNSQISGPSRLNIAGNTLRQPLSA